MKHIARACFLAIIHPLMLEMVDVRNENQCECTSPLSRYNPPQHHNIAHLDVALERPFFKKNPFFFTQAFDTTISKIFFLNAHCAPAKHKRD
jgi:hypothetical protein